MSLTKSAAITLFQSQIRRWNAHKIFLKEVANHTKREGLILELKQTELGYYQKIQNCVTLFLQPLLQNAMSESPFINLTQIRKIFADIEVIVGLTKDLLADLEEITSIQAIGELFEERATELCWYSSFCAAYSEVHSTLVQFKKEIPQFKEFLAKTERQAREDLESTLIRCVQRIPQYKMILTEILENTNPNETGYDKLSSGIKAISLTGIKINEACRDRHNFSRVIELSQQFVGFADLAVVHRRIVQEKSFVSVTTELPNYFFLFNDLFVLAQPLVGQQKETQYEILYWAYLITFRGDPNVIISELSDNTFELTAKDKVMKFLVINQSDYDQMSAALHQEIQKQQTQEMSRKNEEAEKLKSKKPEHKVSDPTLLPYHMIWPEGIEIASSAAQKCPELLTFSPILWGSPIGLRDKNIQLKILPHFLLISSFHVHFVDAVKFKISLTIHQSNILDITYHLGMSEIQCRYRLAHCSAIESTSGISEQCENMLDAFKHVLSLNFPSHKFPILSAGIELDLSRTKSDFELASVSLKQGFLPVYFANCNYFKSEPRKDVINEIEAYSKDRNTVFNLSAFTALPVEDLKIVFRSIIFVSQFTSLAIDKLTPSFTKQVFPFIVDLLSKSNYIRDLTFSHLQISKEHIQTLSEELSKNASLPLKRFTWVHIHTSDSSFKHLIDALKHFDIEHLDFSNCEAKKHWDEAFKALSPASLTHFDVKNNAIPREALDIFGDFVRSQNELKAINLSNINYPRYEFAMFKGSHPAVHQNLIQLNLSMNIISDSAARNLAVFLGLTSSLSDLNVSKTALSIESFQVIFKAISSNINFISNGLSLNISRNEFETSGAQVIAQHVKTLQSNIRVLDLSQNDFHDDGSTAILDALTSNPSSGTGKKGTAARANLVSSLVGFITTKTSVEVFDIECTIDKKANQLGHDIADMLNAFSNITTVTELNISGHKMGQVGASALCHALQVSKVRALYFDDNNLSFSSISLLQPIFLNMTRPVAISTPINDIKGLRENPAALATIESFEESLKNLRSRVEESAKEKLLGRGRVRLTPAEITRASLTHVPENEATFEDADMPVLRVKKKERARIVVDWDEPETSSPLLPATTSPKRPAARTASQIRAESLHHAARPRPELSKDIWVAGFLPTGMKRTSPTNDGGSSP